MSVRIDNERCIACGSCTDVCLMDAIIIKETAVVDENSGIDCGSCIHECLVGALEL